MGIKDYYNRTIGQISRVFVNGQGGLRSNLGLVIPKTQKTVLDTTLLNSQHHKVRILGKMEQSRKWSSTLPLHLGVVAIEKREWLLITLRQIMLCSFLFQIWKLYTITTINPRSQCIDKRGKYFVSLHIWRQNHSKLSQNRCNPLI